MELREGAVIAERFRLIRQLGQGGMGEVWAAQHTSLDIPCAVKFIHAESAQKPEVRARFEREAKAAASLRTPNVVQILDYGIFENTPYIAMEYLEGEPLSARIKRRGRLDPHETFRIIKDVGRALTKAHAAGVVHRDLKPENIFLVIDDDREIAKVLDFGVAKSADQLDSNTQTGALLGTPYYMSPEQAQGTKSVDHRADLWSLAVVVFRCITGDLPFKSTALGDLLIKIVTHPLPVPSQVAAGIPEGFDAWWVRAAQRDPDHRYQSAKDLVQALSMALNVSMPSTLGTTPLPGGPVGAEVRGAQQRIAQTMIAQPNELPPPQPPYPHPHPGYAGGYGGQPAPTVQGFGATPSGHYPPPHVAQPFGLGDSHASASVAGVPLAARPSGGGGGKVALALVITLVLAAGGAGGFFLLGRSEAPLPASPPEGASSESAADGESEEGKPDPAPSPSATSAEPAPASSPEPAPSASEAPPPSPAVAEPAPPRVVPRPVPVPVAVPTPVPVPTPTPTPSPRPPPNDDAGF